MAVTAEEIHKVFDKARDAAADADGNAASEDRCVDALKLLAGMDVPVKLFVDGAVGDVAKGVKKLAKKGSTESVRKAADACVSAWKKILTSGSGGGGGDGDDDAGGVKKESGGGGDGEDAKDGGTPGGKSADGDGDGDVEEKDLKQLLEPALTDPLRERTRELLAEAIALCVGQAGVYASLEDAAQTATAVEKAMYTRWTDTGKEYKAKFRQLSFNLKDPKNPDLRRSVADGLISSSVLLDLSPEELGSDERRGNNAKIREHATNEAVRGQKKEASTDAFKCGKCKKRMCTYYQLQTAGESVHAVTTPTRIGALN